MFDVSIILITYNSGTTIQNCIENIFKSIEYSELKCEVLIIDAHSIDNTKNICIKNYPNKIKFFEINEKNRSKSFNYGVNKSNGFYICRVDARSLIPEKYIKDCYDYLIKNPMYFCVGGRMTAINESDDINFLYNNSTLFGNASFRQSDTDKDVQTVYLGFYSKKNFELLGGYDEENLFINEETDLNFRAIKNNLKIRLLATLEVRYFSRDGTYNLFKTLERYGAARSGFFLKHFYLPKRVLIFLIYYISLYIFIFLSIFINYHYIFLIFIQLTLLTLHFRRSSLKQKKSLSFFKFIQLLLKIFLGHNYWIYGFFKRPFISKNKFN